MTEEELYQTARKALLADWQIGAIPTPFATYVYYHGEKIREYGAARLNQMFALRRFFEAGIPVAPGSDYSPGPFEPMMALQSAVTRTDMNGHIWGPDQRISAAEALRVQTLKRRSCFI